MIHQTTNYKLFSSLHSDFEEHHYANTAHLRGGGGPGSVDGSVYSDTNFSYSRSNPPNPPESILKNGTLPRANHRKATQHLK